MIVLDLEGKPNVGYGDSNFRGLGVDYDPALRWSGIVASEANGLDYNYGYSGQGWLDNGMFTFEKYTMAYFNPNRNKYAWLTNGTNDLALSSEDATKAIFKARLLEIVDYAVSQRWWSYERLVLPTIIPRFDGDYTARILDYNAAIEEICELRNCIFIDPYTQLMANPDVEDLYTDTVHLGEQGQSDLADIYLAADYTPYNGFASELQIPSLQFAIAE